MLANRVFRRLILGFGVSYLGDGMSFVVVAWLAIELAPPETAGLWPGAVGCGNGHTEMPPVTVSASARFQELDWRQTPIGELILRRRQDPVFDQEVYEIKLDDEFLMSSLFTRSETELARLALDLAPGDGAWDVVVGGLGLGYTAQTVLAEAKVGSLLVVEALEPVIEWHQRELIPAGATLAADRRCRLVHGDFFAMAAGGGFDPQQPDRRYHAICVDIDHSPAHLLHPSHGDFYQPAGLRRLADHLHPGGVFALWSNDPPEPGFQAALSEVFPVVTAEVIRFPNRLLGKDSSSTVYLAQTAGRTSH